VLLELLISNNILIIINHWCLLLELHSCSNSFGFYRDSCANDDDDCKHNK